MKIILEENETLKNDIKDMETAVLELNENYEVKFITNF